MTNPLLELGAPNGSIFDKPTGSPVVESKPYVSVSGLGGVASTVADIEHAKMTEVMESGVSAISEIAVDSIAEQGNYAMRIVEAAKNFLLPDAESFRAVLDALDKTMEETPQLDLVGLTKTRSYVQSIMVTMQKDEALAALILPKDAKNIIRFARLQHIQTATMAQLADSKPTKVKKTGGVKAIAGLKPMDF